MCGDDLCLDEDYYEDDNNMPPYHSTDKIIIETAPPTPANARARPGLPLEKRERHGTVYFSFCFFVCFKTLER